MVTLLLARAKFLLTGVFYPSMLLKSQEKVEKWMRNRLGQAILSVISQAKRVYPEYNDINKFIQSTERGL